MEITADRVVTIHYTLKDDQGAVLDSSAGGGPLAYIQGHGNLVSGLEKALEGKQDGTTLAVVVSPAEGYGTRDEALIQRVPKRSLQGSRSTAITRSRINLCISTWKSSACARPRPKSWNMATCMAPAATITRRGGT